jgi:hypothetical protein
MRKENSEFAGIISALDKEHPGSDEVHIYNRFILRREIVKALHEYELDCNSLEWISKRLSMLSNESSSIPSTLFQQITPPTPGSQKLSELCSILPIVQLVED